MKSWTSNLKMWTSDELEFWTQQLKLNHVKAVPTFPTQGQQLLNIRSPLWSNKETHQTLMKISMLRLQMKFTYSWWKLLLGLMQMTTSYVSINNNILTSNFQFKSSIWFAFSTDTITAHTLGIVDWGISQNQNQKEQLDIQNKQIILRCPALFGWFKASK